MPGGVNSPVRAFKNVDGKPVFFKSAKGPTLIDEDDNQYIDFIGSWGPMILGHSNPVVLNAIKAQLELGTSYGAPTSLESELARIIKSQVPSMEKIRMVNSGTEATMSCIRLARGFTGRNKIIKFTGCYHGHVDSLLVKAGSGVSTFGLPDSPGIPKELAALTYSCDYNDAESVIEIANKIGEDLAAIIVEPIAGNMGFIPGEQEFLLALRKLCNKFDSLLIFDEVMSGFRVALGGAQSLYKIEPDLAMFGKSLGNGYAITACIGKKEIMKYANDSFISSTFWTERIGYTAALASISEFERLKVFKKIKKNGKNVKKIWLNLSKKYKIPLKIMGSDAIPSFEFVNNHLLNKTYLTQEMLKNKILATNLVYINIFHDQRNILQYTKVLDKIFNDISKKNIKKKIISKVSFKPIKRIN